MRRKKKERLADEQFWANFAYVNLDTGASVVPSHVHHVRFRLYEANDESLERMVQLVKSINMLDLDETAVTDEGMVYLTELDFLREIRLKGCRLITNAGMASICQFKGLELLHLYGTQVTPLGLEDIGNLKHLKKLLIEADFNDPLLDDIYAILPKDCEFIVNYKDYIHMDR